MLRRARAGTRSEAVRDRTVAAISLAAIVLLSLGVVLMAANRPSLLAPATHNNFYPRWMAGPLGGLLPSLTSNGTTLKFLLTGAVVLMYVAYLIVLRHTRRIPVAWVFCAIASVHVLFVLAPPLALTDIFNYINYGRMEVVHNLNPYTSIPILEPHSDPSYALSNWHQLLSPYGPLFTIVTFAVVPLGVAGSFWALKFLLAAASLGTIVLVWRCAKLLGREPTRAIALVGLNPIVLVWGLGGDHNDFLMVFCIVLGLYLLLLARMRMAQARAAGWGLLLPLSPQLIGGGAAFVLAAGIKASGGVLIPVVLAGLARNRRALTQVVLGMVLSAAIVGAVSLAAFGLHVPDLSTQSRLVTGESIPNLIGLALGLGGESAGLHKVMTVLLVLSVLGCCWVAWHARAAEQPQPEVDASGAQPAGDGARAAHTAPADPAARAGGAGAAGDDARAVDAGPAGLSAPPADAGSAARRIAAPGSVAAAERTIAACGWAGVALLVTLSWVLPWYVVWVLPMAALSASRRLRVAALILGAYLIVAWAPASGKLWSAIGFHPERTPLGMLHQRYVRELLN
ncbi:MAG TPA: hypothetical protein VGD00_00140 [Solirubrobacteraceae bacterium]